MTDHPTTSGEHLDTLDFKGTAIRIHMYDGVPWFAASDLTDALGLNYFATEKVDSAGFPDHAKRTCGETTETGTKGLVVLSPVGVWFLTALNDPIRGQSLAAWARREAKRLCPEPRDNDPAMFLTLMADQTLPPMPMKYSGRRAEWDVLRDSNAYHQRPTRQTLAIRAMREARDAARAEQTAAAAQ